MIFMNLVILDTDLCVVSSHNPMVSPVNGKLENSLSLNETKGRIMTGLRFGPTGK